MKTKILANKYRPNNFDEIKGQDNIIKIIKNSIKNQKFHQTYLFNGPSGTGKTTLARILSKSLNCLKNNKKNINPCQICKNCIDIDNDKSLDYIEFDAASNRGVEDISKLLENIIYPPFNSKYKIFMIDEVHMLSIFAFNSMLKILEEPPEYIKFILITTEINKIPITILSRCLQFNFRKISENLIKDYLIFILKNEKILFEENAIILISNLSKGSLRDAISILDQIISFSNNNITLKSLKSMLGSIDESYLIDLLNYIILKDIKKITNIIDEISLLNISFKYILLDLSNLIYKIILIKNNIQLNIIEKINDNKNINILDIYKISKNIDYETAQIFYDIIIYGIDEIDLSPSDYIGFTIIIYKMLNKFSSNIKIKCIK